MSNVLKESSSFDASSLRCFSRLNDSLKSFDSIGNVSSELNDAEDFIETVDWTGNPLKTATASSNISSTISSKLNWLLLDQKPTTSNKVEECSSDSSTCLTNIPSDDFSTIDQIVNTISSKDPSHLEYTKLKHSFEKYKRDHHRRPADITETMCSLICGRTCCLDTYKSKKEKIALLENSVASFDGNAVLAVLIFLHSSLSKEVFLQVLLANVVAANHYVEYLKNSKQPLELVEILNMLGRCDEADMIEYRTICESESNSIRIRQLKKMIRDEKLTILVDCLVDYINLMERLETLSQRMSKSGGENERFSDASVLDLLALCSVGDQFSQLTCANRESISNCHKLSDKQVSYVVMKTYCRKHMWKEIEEFFKLKPFFGQPSMRTDIVPIEKIIVCLYQNGASKRILLPYIKLLRESSRSSPSILQIIENVENTDQAQQVANDEISETSGFLRNISNYFSFNNSAHS